MMNNRQGYDRFVRSAKANLRYWQVKFIDAEHEKLQEMRESFMLVCRAVRIALGAETLVADAAHLTIDAAQFAEHCNRWAEWCLVLEEALAKLSAEKDNLRCQLLLQIGRFYRLDHRFEQALQALNTACEIAETQGNRPNEQRALVNIATCHLDVGNRVAAKTCLDRVVTCLDESAGETPLHATLFNNLGHFYLEHSKDFPRAIEYFEKSLQIYKLQNDPINYPRVLQNLGHVLLFSGQLDEAAVCLQEATHRFQSINARRDTANVFVSLGTLYFMQKRWAKAEETFRQIDLAYLERVGYVKLSAMAFNNLGNAVLKNGRPMEARKLLEDGLALWKVFGAPDEYANTLGTIGETYLAQEEWSLAVKTLHSAIEILKNEPQSRKVDRWLENLNKLHQLAECKQNDCPEPDDEV